jgi:glycosyltransferase 2 family protein
LSGKPANSWIAWGGLAVSIVCLYLTFRGADLHAMVLTLSHAHLWLALPLLLLHFPFFGFKAARWRLLLAPVRLTPTGSLVAPMMIGFMGNNLLPARLGELVRMYLGARLMRIGQAQVLATLILERMFDVIAVLMFFGIVVIGANDVPEKLVAAGYVTTAASAIGITAVAVYVIWTKAILRWAASMSRFLPAKVSRAILHQLEMGALGMGAMRQPGLLFLIVLNSCLQWLLMALCIYLSFLAVDIKAPVSASFVVLAATAFGVMIPAAPGFFGTLHLMFVLALTPFGVGENRAMAAAVFFHIIPYAGVTLAGLYCMRQVGVRFHEIKRANLERDAES